MQNGAPDTHVTSLINERRQYTVYDITSLTCSPFSVDVCRTHHRHDDCLLFQYTYSVRRTLNCRFIAFVRRLECSFDKCHVTHLADAECNRDVCKINSRRVRWAVELISNLTENIQYFWSKPSGRIPSPHKNSSSIRCKCLIKGDNFQSWSKWISCIFLCCCWWCEFNSDIIRLNDRMDD